MSQNTLIADRVMTDLEVQHEIIAIRTGLFGSVEVLVGYLVRLEELHACLERKAPDRFRDHQEAA